MSDDSMWTVEKIEEDQRNEIKQNVDKIEDYQSRFSDLKTEVGKFDTKIENIEERITQAKQDSMASENRMTGIVIGMIFVLVITIVLIGLDYMYYSPQRYEKLLDKISDIENKSYSNNKSNIEIDNIQRNTNILNCLKEKGYYSNQCFK